MSTGSWPLDLFWILSVAIIAFAVAAYVVGELFERRHNRQKDTASAPRASQAGGVRS